MTRDEAELIAWVIGGADSGCPPCVDSLIRDLNAAQGEWEFFLPEDESEESKAVQRSWTRMGRDIEDPCRMEVGVKAARSVSASDHSAL